MFKFLSVANWNISFPIKNSLCLRLYLLTTTLLLSSLVTSQTYLTNGVGAYSEFNEDTLLVQLELESPATDALEAIAVDTGKKLSFKFLKSKSPRLWSRIWIQNLSINNPPDTITAQTNDLIAMTQAIKGTLQIGDLIEFERIANDLTILSINGNEITDFETPEFFEFLLTAFIGSIPPSSELKADILSGGDINNDKKVLFDSMGYTAQRAAQIAKWGAPKPEPVKEVVEVAEEATEVEELEEVEGEAGAPTEESTDVAVETVEAVEEVTEIEVAEEVVEAEEELEEEDAAIIITAESLLAAQNYQRSVLTSVYQNIKYPSSALRRNREGSLRVSIAINEDGSLNNIEVTQNARYEVFDKAAIDATNKAKFDPLPAGTLEIPMVLEIPIAFQLN